MAGGPEHVPSLGLFKKQSSSSGEMDECPYEFNWRNSKHQEGEKVKNKTTKRQGQDCAHQLFDEITVRVFKSMNPDQTKLISLPSCLTPNGTYKTLLFWFEADNWISRMQQQKKTLGSRPPGCVNKCMNCTPCRATLVIPPHHRMTDYRDQSSHREDDCYYLLSWKCKCGDKLFQP
ncbi:hypothetical protein Ccrd_004922 [Cynara cardunculus var. scolymus]|uniref:Epidermal patterning factor-like protein n=1 Tax=Cynara cardunculus var. scolymus TaxID=59895 RepID=A0A103XLR7_CYNCS|nr:hypothetical protein Ccrd_004922 [Cynara cardunculus var. scolymus]